MIELTVTVHIDGDTTRIEDRVDHVTIVAIRDAMVAVAELATSHYESVVLSSIDWNRRPE